MNRISEAHIFALRLFNSFNSDTTKINYQFLNDKNLYLEICSKAAVVWFVSNTGFLLTRLICLQQDVKTNNLPGFGSANESITAQQFIFKVTLDSTGSQCCTVDSYTPAVPTTNPYTVKKCKIILFLFFKLS